ncbi:MAG: RNase adapter RapZ [Alphaproteobacteria bacterium]|nr:RNase adapter RapZ [Alphaproteobacteria bacterium]
MSGAGRSTALRILEDIGYGTFDKFPASLVPALISSAADGTAIAVGADVRTHGFAPKTLIDTLVNIVAGSGRELRVVFIDCDDDRLERRYTKTRRPHPLAGGRPTVDGIRRERQMLSPLRVRSDLLIDTSTLTATQLKRLLIGYFALDAVKLRVFVTSFAYHQGLPREADLVFDARFLENPYCIDGLRGLTGCDPAVAARIERDAGFADFFEKLRGLLLTLLPRYEASGKTYLTIAVGCTGGRHRSVYVAERLAACLRDAGWQTELTHRDLSPYATDAPDMTGANAAGVH